MRQSIHQQRRGCLEPYSTTEYDCSDGIKTHSGRSAIHANDTRDAVPLRRDKIVNKKLILILGIAILATFALLLSACGDDDDSDSKDCNQCATPTASPAVTPSATEAPVDAPAPISAPAPIIVWNGGSGSESGGNETTTVNSSSNSSSSVSVVVPSEPIAPQPPANPTPIVVPPVVNPTPVPQPAATCRVIHDYQLQDLTEVATSGSHIHVEYWTDGHPERETMLPARDADGGRFILTQPLRGHVWEYADCSDDQVMSQINAHIQRRLAGHANNAGFVQWTTTGLFQPS